MKLDVNGKNESPLYRYLKRSCPVPTSATYSHTETFWDPISVNDISWNFEKFLIDTQGRPLFRFRPNVEPRDLQQLITLMHESGSREDTEVWIAQVQTELTIIHEAIEERERLAK